MFSHVFRFIDESVVIFCCVPVAGCEKHVQYRLKQNCKPTAQHCNDSSGLQAIQKMRHELEYSGDE